MNLTEKETIEKRIKNVTILGIMLCCNVIITFAAIVSLIPISVAWIAIILSIIVLVAFCIDDIRCKK